MNKTANDVEKWEDRHPEAAEGKLVTLESSPAGMMQIAQRTGMGIDDLKAMLELQKEWEKNEARKAYYAAMAKFKKNPPEIKKSVHVNYSTSGNSPNVDYWHASHDDVAREISKAMAPFGLYPSWIPDQKDGKVFITCRVAHEMGHYEEVTMSAAPDTSGNKSEIKAIVSTKTYLERHTLTAITGMSTGEHDDDGKGADDPIEYISTDQETEINNLINETKSNIPAFLKWIKADSVETIAAKDYKKAITMLRAKKEKAA